MHVIHYRTNAILTLHNFSMYQRFMSQCVPIRFVEKKWFHTFSFGFVPVMSVLFSGEIVKNIHKIQT